MLCGFGVLIDYHENVHKAIFRNYGIESKITYFNMDHFNIFDMTASTEPIGDYVCNIQCISDQNNADNMGYHMIALILNMWIIFTLFIMFIWLII